MAFIQDRFKLSLEALSEAVLVVLEAFWSSLGAVLEPLESLLLRLGEALRDQDDF